MGRMGKRKRQMGMDGRIREDGKERKEECWSPVIGYRCFYPSPSAPVPLCTFNGG
jgi:hypothetical protein